MGKSATPVAINVTADPPIPWPVGTVVSISVNWLTPSSVSTNPLDVLVKDASGVTTYPIGVLAVGQTITVQHPCGAVGSTTVTVSEEVPKGHGTHLVDLGDFFQFTVV